MGDMLLGAFWLGYPSVITALACVVVVIIAGRGGLLSDDTSVVGSGFLPDPFGVNSLDKVGISGSSCWTLSLLLFVRRSLLGLPAVSLAVTKRHGIVVVHTAGRRLRSRLVL